MTDEWMDNNDNSYDNEWIEEIVTYSNGGIHDEVLSWQFAGTQLMKKSTQRCAIYIETKSMFQWKS